MEGLTWGKRRSSRFSLCLGRPLSCLTLEESAEPRRRTRSAMPGRQWGRSRCSGHTGWCSLGWCHTCTHRHTGVLTSWAEPHPQYKTVRFPLNNWIFFFFFFLKRNPVFQIFIETLQHPRRSSISMPYVSNRNVAPSRRSEWAPSEQTNSNTVYMA